MTPSWEALVARARGLSTHLLPAGRMQALERAVGVSEVMHELRETPYGDFMEATEPNAAAVELAVTRSLAQRLALLAKWAGPDGHALGPVFIAQDARNIRDILRGVVGVSAPEERIASAIPTPNLGWKRLEALARLDSPEAVVAKLVVWEHPLGAALVEEAGKTRPDLFRLETALARGAAVAGSRAARRGGSRMRAFVRETIDARNAVTALLLVGTRAEGESAEFFVDGGQSLALHAFVRAAAAPDRASAAEMLAAASRGTPLAVALRGAPARPAALSARILSASIADYARRSRQEPLTALPVILFVLRLQREASAVRRALWSAALAGGGKS